MSFIYLIILNPLRRFSKKHHYSRTIIFCYRIVNYFVEREISNMSLDKEKIDYRMEVN